MTQTTSPSTNPIYPDGLPEGSPLASIDISSFDQAQFRASESIIIARPSSEVFAAVSDITRTGEWSPVCTGCEWKPLEDGTVPTAPAVGQWFIGHNHTPSRTWDTESQVRTFIPGTEFSWTVANPTLGSVVTWGYRVESTPDGATHLTEFWEVLPSGFAFFIHKYGESAASELADRRDAALRGIPETLQRIKEILEQ